MDWEHDHTRAKELVKEREKRQWEEAAKRWQDKYTVPVTVEPDPPIALAMTTRLIGLTGRAGCGKDSVAGFIIKEWGSHDEVAVATVRFSEPLKQLVSSMFEIPRMVMEDPGLKETGLARWNGRSAREILQILGTDGFRAIDPDYWVKLARREIEEALERGRRVVCPDVRFENEARAIRDLGGEVWKIMKTDGPTTAHGRHASETEMGGIFPDVVLKAPHGQLDSLRDQAVRALWHEPQPVTQSIAAKPAEAEGVLEDPRRFEGPAWHADSKPPTQVVHARRIFPDCASSAAECFHCGNACCEVTCECGKACGTELEEPQQ
jgi:hypothetical protein